jgi:2-aminobenzoate-CoA ligase
LEVQPDDVFIGSPPLAFTFGFGGLVLFPMRFGAACVLLEDAAPARLLAAIEHFRPSVCFTAPTAYQRILQEAAPGALSSLTRCVSAGEHLTQTVSDAWQKATGIRIIDGIGSTEMLHIFISAAGDRIRPGATGLAVPGYEARVVDDNMQELTAGEVGQLAVRGPTGCRYLADARQHDYVRGGWNITGDAYWRDEDGYFWFFSRADDLIVSAGYNISPAEVEQALVQHGAVADVAVVRVPDSRRGQLVKAFVVLTPENSDEPEALVKKLQDFVKQQIAPYKYPRAIEFVAALPRTESGKIKRTELR